MTWKCATCGLEHEEAPLCFSSEAPWPSLVPANEFEERVELTSDQCIVDKKYFFIRGHIEIPLQDSPQTLTFSVWSSLSEKSFAHMSEHWEDAGRWTDAPYFGWLSSSIPVYPTTINLKLSVQSREPGVVPLFTVERTDHPLAMDQHNGITTARWNDLAHRLLHAQD
jgi:hypothetical protein